MRTISKNQVRLCSPCLPVRGWRESTALQRSALFACCFFTFCVIPKSAWGQLDTIRRDEVKLHSGQTIYGSVEEKRTEKGIELLVQLDDGTTLLLDRKAYQRWSAEPEAMVKYRQLNQQIKWTLEDQLKMARWCDENRLKELKNRHYRIAMEIDPDNEEARKKLGYIQREGSWVNTAEIKQRLGYQKQGGQWVLPEVKELRDAMSAYKDRQQDWKNKLRILNTKAFSRGRNAGEAIAELRAISDPEAVEPLLDRLSDSKSLPQQQLYVDILCNIDSYASSKALVKFYLFNQNDPESRTRCLETVLKRKSYQQTALFDFAAALNPDFSEDGKKETDPELNTQRMGRAAFGLESIGVPFAIEGLIRALVVNYKQESKTAPSSSFGSNGSVSNNPGGGTKVTEFQLQCPRALDALRKFTGLDPGFGYDQMAWAQWWVQENTPGEIDLRRDR